MSKTNLSSDLLATELFNNESYRNELIRDFEIKFTTTGELIYNPEVFELFVNFLANHNESLEWEEDATVEDKLNFSMEIAGKFMNMVCLKYSYLARFSVN